MKPAPFDYTAPRTVAEALSAAGEAEDPKFLAGGQSLVPVMSLRMARPDLVVDLNRVEELEHLVVTDGQVRLGALCRHRRLELDPEIGRVAPLLQQAAGQIGHPAIRNRGTLGGTIAHADPAAELPAAIMALDAEVIVRSETGERAIRAAELFDGFFMTAIEPEELLVEVRVPVAGADVGSAFEEHAPRHGDFALVGIAAVVRRGADGACADVRLAGAGVGSTPVDLSAAGEPLLGEDAFGPSALRELATRVAALGEPASDTHASAEDRRELMQLLTIRAVRAAWERAGGETARAAA